MSPRIPTSGLGRDRHGVLDARSFEPDAVRAATSRYDEAVHGLEGVDAATVELVRIRNANYQRCHL